MKKTDNVYTKILDNRSDLDESVIFKGWYVSPSNIKTLLCVSESKSLVKSYLRSYRGLKKGEYKIEETYATYGEILSQFDNFVISKWFDHYIPMIDQIYLSMHSNNVQQMLTETICNLNSINMHCIDIDKISKKDNAILASAVRVLLHLIQNSKSISRIEKSYFKESLYAPIEVYLKNVQLTLDMMRLDQDYKDALYYND